MVMVNPLDWVVSMVPEPEQVIGVVMGLLMVVVQVLAITRTGVLITPASTVMTTSPLLSDIAVGGLPAGVRVMPPMAVVNAKVTVCPLNGLLFAPTTLNVTCEVSVPPMPFNEMMVGEAETNCTEPVEGTPINKFAETEAMPETVAVTVSVPAQPLSR